MKIAVGVFFLSFLITLPASAAEVSLQLPSDYSVSKVAELGRVGAFTFDFEGNYIVAENIGNANRVSKVAPDGTTTVLLDRTSQTITNLSYNKGIVYIVTRGRIYKIVKGKISDVISGLPTNGDYGNSNLVFDNGYMYLAIGTATNSGIVGPDNTWLSSNPSVHDIPCVPVKLTGFNANTDNYLTAKKDDKAVTGSFSTFNTPITADQTVYGMNKCNGAIIKVTPDGLVSQLYAWGFHNPKGLSIDDDGRLWILDGGMEDRGLRPIKNGKDALYQVSNNTWYGWPDFSAGQKVDQPLLSEYPNNPPQPQTTFDLNQIKYLQISPRKFGNSAIAQTADDKLQQLNLSSHNLQDFLTVANGQVIQYKFGPNDKLYVLVATSKDKTALYAIESTKPVSTIVGSTTKSKPAATNWTIGILLAATLGGIAFYVLRNFRYPIKPL